MTLKRCKRPTRIFRLRDLSKTRASKADSIPFNHHGDAYYVIGYQACGSASVLMSTDDKTEADSMRDSFEANLEGYERITVEKARKA